MGPHSLFEGGAFLISPLEKPPLVIPRFLLGLAGGLVFQGCWGC